MKLTDLDRATAATLRDTYITLATDGQFALDEIHSVLDKCDAYLFSPGADETSAAWIRIARFRGALLYKSSGIVARLQGRVADALRHESAAEQLAARL